MTQMKHADSTLRTKKKLSASLKAHMAQKPLSKIAVRELTDDCGLNRKTFYYHFPDIRHLLKWTLEQEAMNTIREYGEINNYNDAIKFTVDYIGDNKNLLKSAYDSIGHDAIRYFCNKDFRDIIVSAVRIEEDKQGARLNESFRCFIGDFFAETLSGLIANVFDETLAYDKTQLTRYLTISLKSAIPAIVIAASESGEL